VIEELKRSHSPDISTASSPNQIMTPALPPSSAAQEEVVPPALPAQASGRRASSPVRNNKDAASAEAVLALNSDQITSAGATVYNNPLSTESIKPTLTLRPPSVRQYVTEATLVDTSAPAVTAPVTDPLCDELLVIDDLSSLYLRLGAAAAPLSTLESALANAVACCDDVLGGPPTDLPPLENVSLSNALEILAGTSDIYRKHGSRRMPVPVVREALVRAMVPCKKKKAKAKPGRHMLRQWGL